LRDHVDTNHALEIDFLVIMSGNGWLARQRKSDLVDIAQTLGLKEYVFFFLSFFAYIFANPVSG